MLLFMPALYFLALYFLALFFLALFLLLTNHPTASVREVSLLSKSSFLSLSRKELADPFSSLHPIAAFI